MDLKHDRVRSSEIVTAVVNVLSYFLIKYIIHMERKISCKAF